MAQERIFPIMSSPFPILSNLPGLQALDPLVFSLQSGMMVMAAVSTAVSYRLADHLERGPQTIEELAQHTGTHAPSLYLLMRALAAIGIFAEVDEQTHTFANTDRSLLLRDTAMADLVRLWSAPYQWHAWQQLSSTIRTGKPALEGIYGPGTTIWTFLEEHPEERRIFHRGLTAVSNLIIPAILATYDFSAVRHLVDVGGGYGNLIVHVLSQYPHLLATLFDQASIIEEAEHARAHDWQQEIAQRATLQVGNFFQSLPAERDCYILKNVLMDWSDEPYLQIIGNCREAMNPSGCILVIEPVIGPSTPFTKFFSLQMALMMHAAHHRTLKEHQALFERAGFRLVRALSLGLEQMLLQFERQEEEESE